MEGFSNKEMLIRILDKLDKMEDRVDNIHACTKQTNGRVKLHTRAIYGLAGFVVSLTGWFISHLIY